MAVMGSPSLPTCNSNSCQFDGNTHTPSLLFLHRFSIPDSALTRYDSYPERMLLDAKPDHLMEKMYEHSDLVDFKNFIGLLTHKLQVLTSHDSIEHAGTECAYPMSTNVMPSDLHHSFISDCNKPTFDPLLISMSRSAEDISDSSYQKSTFAFLTRCVQDG
ncbi:uncharacterized protein HD556DRAFT_1310815 [Suillus plorans]|uniref:Uncharacterized protein n=1 Tax=Suillus plorans TaxID=116603 RepID=A0A9P7AJN6_9AGAM|nr:uncharacterized protein HD556DRAFT_1310815 [Suillus plorans]KAG1790226.1 hypothetical protein HD556DRAFT_1310815 [Suillus plorans]